MYLLVYLMSLYQRGNYSLMYKDETIEIIFSHLLNVGTNMAHIQTKPSLNFKVKC